MRLLVVEDDRRLADVLRRGLSEEGYAVDLSANGDDALLQTAVTTHDAIVLDLMLPGKDGAAHRGWLHSGFQAAGAGDLQVASQSIDRGGRVAGYVLVWQPRESVERARHSLLLVIMTIGPALLIAAGLGGWALAGRALAPVVQVTEAASAISGSDLSRRVEVGPAQDELSKLAATFNAMIDRLQSAVERERRFTADASHELRAPLAVIRAEATLALDRPRGVGEYRRALAVIDEEAEATQTLIAELLSLARAGSEAEGERQRVPLDEVIVAAVEQCRLLQERRGVDVDVQAGTNLWVNASMPLLTRAVRNIVDNAIRVSGDGETVRIRAWRDGERLISHRSPRRRSARRRRWNRISGGAQQLGIEESARGLA